MSRTKKEILDYHLEGIFELLYFYEYKQEVGTCPLCFAANRLHVSARRSRKNVCHFCPWMILEKTTCLKYVVNHPKNTNRMGILGLQTHSENTEWWRTEAIARLKRWIKNIKDLKIKEKTCQK